MPPFDSWDSILIPDALPVPVPLPFVPVTTGIQRNNSYYQNQDQGFRRHQLPFSKY